MKKSIVLLPLMAASFATGIMDIAVPPISQQVVNPEEKALRVAHVTTIVAACLSPIIVGAAGIVGIALAKNDRDRAITAAIGIPATLVSPIAAYATFQATTHYLATKYLAHKYGCSREIITMALKYALPIDPAAELLNTAYQGQREMKAVLLSEVKDCLGSVERFNEMINDLEKVMKIENSDKTDRQKLKALRDLGYLEKYTPKERQQFSLIARLLFAAHELYSKKSLDLKSTLHVYIGPYLRMSPHLITDLRSIVAQLAEVAS